MKKAALRFLLQLSIVTIALVLVLFVVLEMMNWIVPTFALAIFVVLFVVTFLVFLLQAKIMIKYPDYSLHVILGSLIIRLIIFALFNFIMIYTDRINVLPNIILFFSVYMVYTLVEMITLFKQIRLSKSQS